MARITITIEDLPQNKVKIEMNPNFETMMKMEISGSKMTSAHGYALCAVNAIRKESKRLGPQRIFVPKLRING